MTKNYQVKEDKIVSIKKIGDEMTYDLTVKDDHSFIANGVLLQNSRNPNFQNIPSRGAFAKIIKRQFIAERGHLYIKSDYNAHEIRSWASLSGDEKIAEAFRVGSILRKKIFLEEDAERRNLLLKDLKGKGDVHRINYGFFFGKNPAEVTDEERNKVKAVMFGVMYGKGRKTLAEDLKCSEDQAQSLLDALEKMFPVGWEWLLRMQREGREKLHVTSPIGRVRHLCNYLYPEKAVRKAIDRKTPNSLIQGFSSDMGYQGGRLLQELIHKRLKKETGEKISLYQNNAVHDSIEAVSKIEHIPISIYLIETAFTTCVLEKYKQVFDFNCILEPEMESEIGWNIANTSKFSWETLVEDVKKHVTESNTELQWEYSDAELNEAFEKLAINHECMHKVKKNELSKYLDLFEKKQKKVFDITILNQPESLKRLLNKLVF